MWYALSNKNKKFVVQVANKENRARFYRDLKRRLDDTRKDEQATAEPEMAAPIARPPAKKRTERIAGDNNLQLMDPKARYHIGTRASIQYDLPSWLYDNSEDPAVKVCFDYSCELG